MVAPTRILIVDDDPEVREILLETLVDFGHAVTEAASGEDALPILRADPNIGLLISDIRMAGMSGIELADYTRSLRPEVKIILISGYFLPQQVSHRFLRKPFHMRELATAIREVLA